MTKLTDISQQQVVKYLRFLYPVWTVVGLFGVMYARNSLIVVGDAAATAINITASELVFRLGIVASLTTQLIHIAVVVLLYKLFRRVNKDHAMLLVVLGLVGVPISMLNTLNRVAALLLLNNPDLMMLFLNLNEQGMNIAKLFWGLWLFPLGLLIKQSGYFPKIIGTLVLFAGFAYFMEPFFRFLLPNQSPIYSPIVMLLTMGEIIFMLWIVFKGAKLSKKKSSN